MKSEFAKNAAYSVIQRYTEKRAISWESLPESMQDFAATLGIGPKALPIEPSPKHECPKCKGTQAYYKEEGSDCDGGQNEMVLYCPDCQSRSAGSNMKMTWVTVSGKKVPVCEDCLKGSHGSDKHKRSPGSRCENTGKIDGRNMQCFCDAGDEVEKAIENARKPMKSIMDQFKDLEKVPLSKWPVDRRTEYERLMKEFNEKSRSKLIPQRAMAGRIAFSILKSQIPRMALALADAPECLKRKCSDAIIEASAELGSKSMSAVLHKHINYDAKVVRTFKPAYSINECIGCFDNGSCDNQYVTGTGSIGLKRSPCFGSKKTAGYERDKLKPGYKGKFVIQLHHAKKAGDHFDLRISFPVDSLAKSLNHYYGKRKPESGEPREEYPDKPGVVYRSWAVKKHTLPTANNKLFVMETEDHPLSYGTFEGTIPEDHYGAGEVSVWDHGTYELSDVEGDKKYVFNFHGNKLDGEYALVKYQKGFLWVKTKEEKSRISLDKVLYLHRLNNL